MAEITYEEWCRKVNTILIGKFGLEMDDFADGPSWDRWDEDNTPEEYVRELMVDWNDMSEDEFELIFQ